MQNGAQYNDGNFLPFGSEFAGELGPGTFMNKTVNPYVVESLEMSLRCPKQKRGENRRKQCPRIGYRTVNGLITVKARTSLTIQMNKLVVGYYFNQRTV
jgi:hypothetical protein